jgi:RimJ/RimL family protein N-acetyltransferase
VAGPGPVLETARLRLRPPGSDDFDAWAAMLADEPVARFVGGVQGATGAWRSLSSVAGAWALYGFGMFSVVERASGRWIGRIGPWQPAGWPGPEIGWALVRDAWGQGYATEAAARTATWARDALGWTHMIHPIHPDNAPSMRVAMRLGSRPLDGYDTRSIHPDLPLLVYGRSLVDWPAGADLPPA